MPIIVNWEIVVRTFLHRMANVEIKCMKIMHSINSNNYYDKGLFFKKLFNMNIYHEKYY